MIGQSAHLFIRVRMLGGEILGSILTPVSPALSSVRGHAPRGMDVSMLMEFLSPGYILPSTEPDFARMRSAARAKSVSLLTSPKSCALYMHPRVQLCLHLALFQPVQWT